MNQKILVLSGHKEAGKNTLANFLQGLELLNLGIISEFEVSSKTKGQLWVKTADKFGQLDLCSQDKNTINWASENLWPFIKQYAYADDLKQLCMNILLLTYEQCYGTNEEKNSLTKYYWENMPGLSETEYKDNTGLMTAREIIQYVGTEIFRKMYGDVWVEACLNRIKKENSEFVIITDCRFPNEVLIPKRRGAKIIRLTRTPNPNDKHSSETSLDKDVFDWKIFDHILDNENISIEESCVEFIDILKQWGWINYTFKVN